MPISIKFRRIFISPDLGFALIGGIIFVLYTDNPASAEIIKELSSLAVTILSIIFSVFFAALAVLITSGDNNFVLFLQKFNGYTEIIWSFKVTFSIIFFALLFSLILYISTLFELSKETAGVYPDFISVPYVISLLYALFSTVASSIDAIKYAERRIMFLSIKNSKENHGDN